MSILSKVLRAGEGRKARALQAIVPDINALEPEMQAQSDAELRHKTVEFRQRLLAGSRVGTPIADLLNDLLVEAFAVVREAARRVIGQRHFDVQLMGGAALHFGWIAEMRTGEGKTLVSTLPVYLNGLTGWGVHVVTVNDYLARRDAEWMGQIHRFLGLSVGLVAPEVDDDVLKRQAYACDVTYGTNTEFGFDYLRDNMARSKDAMAQRGHVYAIVDEVDSILVDEARTPLIISGPAAESAQLYYQFAGIVRTLVPEVDYEVEEKKHTVVPTDSGIEKVEAQLGVDNMYDAVSVNFVHQLENALRAKELYKRDKDYVVTDGEVKIVDEFTGRFLEGRRWSDGLHQAVEAKERVKIKEENHTWATVTLQNYFRLYEKLAGMTGTAETEASEFANTYGLPVVPIPTHKPMIRIDAGDVIYKTEQAKFDAVVSDVVERNDKGQPVLIGTASVEKSEILSRMLEKKGINHTVLNAKQHSREANVVAQAGRLGAVTVATNMAGRGVDIILGGNPLMLLKTAASVEFGEALDPALIGELMSQAPDLVTPLWLGRDYPVAPFDADAFGDYFAHLLRQDFEKLRGVISERTGLSEDDWSTWIAKASSTIRRFRAVDPGAYLQVSKNVDVQGQARDLTSKHEVNWASRYLDILAKYEHPATLAREELRKELDPAPTYSLDPALLAEAMSHDTVELAIALGLIQKDGGKRNDADVPGIVTDLVTGKLTAGLLSERTGYSEKMASERMSTARLLLGRFRTIDPETHAHVVRKFELREEAGDLVSDHLEGVRDQAEELILKQEIEWASRYLDILAKYEHPATLAREELRNELNPVPGYSLGPSLIAEVMSDDTVKLATALRLIRDDVASQNPAELSGVVTDIVVGKLTTGLLCERTGYSEEIGAERMSTARLLLGRFRAIDPETQGEVVKKLELRSKASQLLHREDYLVRYLSVLAEVGELWEAEGEKIRELGGLYVLGSERHESRRIDNQLRGRTGRQGDPGESRFFLSLEDELMRLFATGAMSWVMGKALPDDVPIEARMVTKAIERAQSTVEQRNAETRKDVLKYDEVMNEQRKVIYARRLEVIEGENLRERTIEVLTSAIEGLVQAYLPSDYEEDWDLDGLLTEVRLYYPTEFSAEDLGQASSKDQVLESILTEAVDHYEKREQSMPEGVETMRELEREIMLQIIDQKWREHLAEMDYLREGINLRAMGQQDPLVAWQKEGYDMFGRMIAGLDDDYVKYVMHAEFVADQPDVPDLDRAEYVAADEPVQDLSLAAAAPQAGAGAPPAAEEVTQEPVIKSSEEKIGRNQPCHCGSGKKFKLCHGK